MKKLTVIAVSIAMVATFAMTAAASEWNFYGSARMTTFVEDLDVPGGEDITTLDNSLQSNSRIGATVKVSDAVGGGFEYGTTVNLRKLYGTWNFGAGELLIGQTYTPFNLFYSNQVWGGDNDLLSYGAIYAGRHPMIRLKFGDFQIAAIEPETDMLNSGVNSFTEVTFPKIEARYDMNFGALTLNVTGGFNTYELTDSDTGVAHDVDSYVLGLAGKVNFGPAYIAGNAWFGENVGVYGIANSPVDDPTITGSTLSDNDAYGFIFVVGAKLNDMFSFEAGYGWAEAELDSAGSNEDDAQSYYVQSTITFVPGVFIVPEIGVVDEKQDAAGVEEAETVYYGLKWQINF
ncbi:MAG: porin [Desulfobacteraceae bacterium]|nr:porin [Desulfobacteraceae bacterium]